MTDQSNWSRITPSEKLPEPEVPYGTRQVPPDAAFCVECNEPVECLIYSPITDNTWKPGWRRMRYVCPCQARTLAQQTQHADLHRWRAQVRPLIITEPLPQDLTPVWEAWVTGIVQRIRAERKHILRCTQLSPTTRLLPACAQVVNRLHAHHLRAAILDPILLPLQQQMERSDRLTEAYAGLCTAELLIITPLEALPQTPAHARQLYDLIRRRAHGATLLFHCLPLTEVFGQGANAIAIRDLLRMESPLRMPPHTADE